MVLGEVRGRRELTEVRENFREVTSTLDLGDRKGILGRETAGVNAVRSEAHGFQGAGVVATLGVQWTWQKVSRTPWEGLPARLGI